MFEALSVSRSSLDDSLFCSQVLAVS